MRYCRVIVVTLSCDHWQLLSRTVYLSFIMDWLPCSPFANRPHMLHYKAHWYISEGHKGLQSARDFHTSSSGQPSSNTTVQCILSQLQLYSVLTAKHLRTYFLNTVSLESLLTYLKERKDFPARTAVSSTTVHVSLSGLFAYGPSTSWSGRQGTAWSGWDDTR